MYKKFIIVLNFIVDTAAMDQIHLPDSGTLDQRGQFHEHTPRTLLIIGKGSRPNTDMSAHLALGFDGNMRKNV